MHRAGRWVEGMILILSGLCSVGHRVHRMVDTMVPALFTLDLAFALLAGLVLTNMVNRQSCAWLKCVSSAVTVLMLVSWCATACNQEASYYLHAVAHVMGVVVLTKLVCGA